MLGIFRMAAIIGTVLLAGPALGQPSDEIIPLPAANDAAAELLYLESLREAANNPVNQREPGPGFANGDRISVTARRPDDVVCSWRRRNGSNIRERRCKSRFQAEREERQTEYAIRRLRGF
ncbi:hypothetical protein [Maricaulis salignorans]|uniref:hypothetical protein n=1 Tax=Maricaulis salignorans TaxID=144026 RepID=UPI003A90EAF5